MATNAGITSEQWVKQTPIVDNWLSSVEDSSAKQYRTRLRSFLEYFDMSVEVFLEEAKNDRITTKTKLNKWYKHLRKTGKSYNTAALYESSIKSFLGFYEIKVKTQKREKPRRFKRKALRKTQIRKLVEISPYLRDKALIVLGFQTGMSISDLLKLNYGDVRKAIEEQLDTFVIEYIRGKAKSEATAVIGKDSITYLTQYIDWRKEQIKTFNKKLPKLNRKRRKDGKPILKEITLSNDSPLFTGVRYFEAQTRLSVRSAQYMMRQTIVKAGLATFEELKKYGKFNPFAFHAVRKAFSSVAKQNGVPFEQIEMSMGHKLPFNGAYDEFTENELIESYKEAEANLSISIDTRELEEKTKATKDELEVLKSENEHLKERLNNIEQLLEKLTTK